MTTCPHCGQAMPNRQIFLEALPDDYCSIAAWGQLQPRQEDEPLPIDTVAAKLETESEP